MLELSDAARASTQDTRADAEHARQVAADEAYIADAYRAWVAAPGIERDLAHLVAFALHDAVTPDDVMGWFRRARSLSVDGYAHFGRQGLSTLLDLFHLRAIPNALFRETFLAREVPHGALALVDYAHEPDDIGVIMRQGQVGRPSRFEGEYGGRGALDGKTSAQEVAERVGLIDGRGVGDSSYLKRLLGITPLSANRHGRRYVQLFVTYRQAVRLCDALGMSYIEAGV